MNVMNLVKLLSLKRFNVKGNSMEPFLYEGDRVLAYTDKESLSKVMPGDIVIAKNNNREIIKRVEKRKGNSLFLVGINADESTDSRDFGFVDESALIGKFLRKY